MSPPLAVGRREPGEQRSLYPVLAWSLAALAGGIAFDLVRHRFFQMDEFVFVRAAWMIGIGQVPYRDFFEHHTPLYYLLLSLPVRFLPESSVAMVGARIASLPIFGLLAVSTWRLSRVVSSGPAALFATGLLLTTPAFLARAIEIRPDLLAAACFLTAATLAAAKRSSTTRSILVGALLACALLSTQKAAHYVWGLALLPFIELAISHPRRWSVLGAPLTLMAAIALFASALASVGAWSSFWNQNVELALLWQTAEPGFSIWAYLGPALASSPIWTGAVVVGGALLAAGQLPPGVEKRSSRVLLATAIPAALSLVTLPNPWPYNYLAVFPALTPLAAIAIHSACDSKLLRVARPALLGAGLAAAALLLIWYSAERLRHNGLQRAVIDTALEITRPDEPVFDSNGGYLFRPSAYFIWYHSSAMRRLMRRQLSEEIVPAILSGGAPLWVRDGRFDELPENVRGFVSSHYLRYFGPLHLWGKRLAGPADDSATARTATFSAVRSGRYFVAVRPRGLGVPWVEVDGETREPGSPFEVSAGEHEIRYRAVAGQELFILWLPANGKTWLPGTAPNVSLYPFFF